MARSITPFRNLILFLRVVAGACGCAALVLYIIVLHTVITDQTSDVGFTTLPIIAGGIILIWNIVSILLMCRARIPHLFLAFGDFCILIAATAMGVTGIYHDIKTYLNDGGQWGYGDYSSSLLVLDIGGVTLLVGLVGQILLVLFNILEYSHLKRTGKRVSLPPYSGYPWVAMENKDHPGTDWKSVISEELIEVKKPLTAVEPKSKV